MAGRTQIGTQIFDQLNNYVGREGQVFIDRGLSPPSPASVVPGHKVSVQGVQATIARSSQRYKNGGAAVAAVKTATINVNPADGDTFPVGNDTLTFRAAPVAATDVLIGGNAAASATNLAAKITARTATEFCTAAAVGAVVTATANTAGVDFVWGPPSNVASITTAVTTPNAGPANFTFQQVLPGNGALVPATQVTYKHTINTNNVDRNILFIYDLQTSDTTLALASAGLLQILKDGWNGIDPTTQAHHGRIKGLGPNDAFTDLGTAMKALFGTILGNAFQLTTTIASNDTILFTVGFTGVNGNNEVGTSELLNSPVQTFGVDITTGIPQTPGIEEVGKYSIFKGSATQVFAKIQTGNSRSPIELPSITETASEFGIWNNADPQKVALGSASSEISYSDTQAIVALNAANLAKINQGAAVFLVFDDGAGGRAVFCFYKCFFGNLDFEGDIAKAGEVKIAVKPQPITGRADKYGYFAAAA